MTRGVQDVPHAGEPYASLPLVQPMRYRPIDMPPKPLDYETRAARPPSANGVLLWLFAITAGTLVGVTALAGCLQSFLSYLGF